MGVPGDSPSTAQHSRVLQTPNPLPKTAVVPGEPPRAGDLRASRMASTEARWLGGTAGDMPGGQPVRGVKG